jgi:hypothetical protein
MSLSDEQPRTRLVLPEEADDGFGPRRPRRPRWIGALAVVVVFGVVLGALAIVDHAGRTNQTASNGATTTARSSAAPSHAATHATSAPPTTVAATPYAGSTFPASSVYNVPVGYADTLAGAESAAVNYAVAYGSAPMAATSTRHAILAAIADPTILTTLQTQLDAAYAAFDQSLGLINGYAPTGYTLAMRTLPVGQKLTSDQPERVTVSVWVDVLSGLAGTNTKHPIGEQWETLAVTVHRTGGDWKWAGFAETDGPTPVNSSQTLSSNEALKSAIEQFGGLLYAP